MSVLLVVAAIATSPDVISQVALALPMYLLFGSSVLICWILRRKKQKNAAELFKSHRS